ncbi:uncharacterized protein si:dkey-86e18.1 isoform X2 [Micropterus salmoides]|uniref:uncharacterized protein si:dkey-86e18.1 isoform X2 n=1 Tax=Micropterus salmoides TaxID=27706 RepID=UPI0018EA8FF5|nr:uncharacterized protein si:dkey-86e18.1 isoform X2 [Micropterus salmoides]
MARNEEKQQGRLNRLWLQKEREEGRLKDVHERRPKLSTLNSASSVKKWIPSIKSEIEYYLQQSQLSHYPERKIAEFQLHIESLEKEYKSFIAKLRVLDPSCKHKPWTPRAYCKRRADTQDSSSIVKVPRPCESHDGCSQWGRGLNESDLACKWAGSPKTSEAVCADQDQPLSFDHTRLAVVAAAFRGSSLQGGASKTQSLARVLQSGLPNLVNASLRQTFSAQSGDTENDDGATMGSAVRQNSDLQENMSDWKAAQRIPGKSSQTVTTEEKSGHVLGLDCYSSSDEECHS